MVGEGPVWDPDSNTLIWTDIRTGRFFHYDPATNQNRQVHDGFNVGGFAFNEFGGLVACIWDGIVLWNSDDDWVRVFDETHEGELLRFNDVTADPGGRMFAGSVIDGGLGRLYRFDPDGSVEIIEEGIGCSNGMGYSPDEVHHVLHRLRRADDIRLRLRQGRPVPFPTGVISSGCRTLPGCRTV